MLPTEKRFCIVTGAASGLGRALALRLAAAGHTVMLTDTSESQLHSALTEAIAFNPECRGRTLDVSCPEAWATAVNDAESQWGRLDLLINCAGALAIGDFWAAPPNQVKKIVEVNLLGVMFGCQTCANLLRQSESGHIINVASCAGFLTFPWSSAYNAAKAGVLAYSESLANELDESPLSVTVAAPGFFQSSLSESASYTDPVTQRCMQRVFERSDLTVETVADAILKGWSRKQLYVMVPWKVRWMWWYKRLLPAQLMRSVQRIARRLRNRYADQRLVD